MGGSGEKLGRRIRMLLGLTLFTGVLGVLGTVWLWFFPAGVEAAGDAATAGAAAAGAAGGVAGERGWGLLAAALATTASCLGAAYAVAHVGAAAVGAVTEKPELMGRMVVLVGLSEGIAIYGVIISILILNKV